MNRQALALFSLLLAGFAFESSAFAQRTTATHPVTLEVYGQARYGDTRAPAANIIVRLETFGGGIVSQMLTDRDGKFRFSGLASTQYRLSIHAPDYMDFQQAIDLLTQTSDYVNVFLAPEPQPSETRKTLRSIGYIDASVPADARKEFERAQTSYFDARNVDQAVRHLERALTLYQKFFEAELSLGTLYMDLSKWEQAESSLKRAIEINRKAPNVYFALGEVYFREERYADAEKALKDGLLLDNRSWKAHFALARIYWKTEDLARTGRQLALTLQLNPNAADAHLLAAKLFMRVRKFEEALTELEDYLRLDPKGAYAEQARATAQTIKSKLPVTSK